VPSKTKKQETLMAVCSDPKKRKKMKGCPPMKVAKEFHAADKRRTSRRSSRKK
jgi:hypothetical protein